jgi:hypothetical protein
MSKLLSILVAGTFAAAGAFAATPSSYSQNYGKSASSETKYSLSSPTHAKRYSAHKITHRLASNEKFGKRCAPGLEKKHNGCLAPGLAKSHENFAKGPDTRVLGAGPMLRDREHERNEHREHRIHRRERMHHER